jgi:hypothetical protein
MKRNLVTQKKQFRTIEEIMAQPTLKAKLNNMVDEAVTCKTKIAQEQQNIKALRDAALEDLGLKPALFNAYVAAVFNNDYTQRREGLEQQLMLIEHIMGEAGQLSNGDDE